MNSNGGTEGRAGAGRSAVGVPGHGRIAARLGGLPALPSRRRLPGLIAGMFFDGFGIRLAAPARGYGQGIHGRGLEAIVRDGAERLDKRRPMLLR